MATDRQTELRLSRLENDTASLYDLVSDISSTQKEHSRRFDAMDGRFDATDQRFDAIDGRFDSMDQRFDTMSGRIDVMVQRFDSFEATLAEAVRRLPQ